MDMKILKSEKRLCTCCMEEHEVKTVLVMDKATFKNTEVVMKPIICIAIWQKNCIWMKNRCRIMILE